MFFQQMAVVSLEEESSFSKFTESHLWTVAKLVFQICTQKLSPSEQ
jgi:hypothetical protein